MFGACLESFSVKSVCTICDFEERLNVGKMTEVEVSEEAIGDGKEATARGSSGIRSWQ